MLNYDRRIASVSFRDDISPDEAAREKLVKIHSHLRPIGERGREREGWGGERKSVKRSIARRQTLVSRTNLRLIRSEKPLGPRNYSQP